MSDSSDGDAGATTVLLALAPGDRCTCDHGFAASSVASTAASSLAFSGAES
jgi:hypothetical protein